MKMSLIARDILQTFMIEQLDSQPVTMSPNEKTYEQTLHIGDCLEYENALRKLGFDVGIPESGNAFLAKTMNNYMNYRCSSALNDLISEISTQLPDDVEVINDDGSLYLRRELTKLDFIRLI